MAFENIYLELNAKRMGYEVVKPAIAAGASGVDHKFSFLASSEGRRYAFDFYDEVTVNEVLKTYIKEVDTGVTTGIVCTSSAVSSEAKDLARLYSMRMISSDELETASSTEVFATLPRPAITSR